MSKVAVKGNDSGTGVFTLEAPATNTDRTLTIPDSDGELLFTDSNGDFSVDGDTFYVDSANNRVGIGTSSPSSPVDVEVSSTTGYELTRNTVTGVWRADTDAIRFGTSSNHNLFFDINNTGQAFITTGGLFAFNSGYGSVATAYGCRAWVNFDGTGTVSIRNSGNVSTVTDQGVGNYQVNFSESMPDNDYALLASAYNRFAGSQSSQTTSGALVRVLSSSGFSDSDQVSVAVIR